MGQIYSAMAVGEAAGGAKLLLALLNGSLGKRGVGVVSVIGVISIFLSVCIVLIGSLLAIASLEFMLALAVN